MLSDDELERYARHIVLREVGGPGQAALRRARVLVIGAGGLGAPVLLYLAAAGVGTLGVIDDDVVTLSNLQRQVIHTTPDIGTPKVKTAAAAIARLNPNVTVKPHHVRLAAGNAPALIDDYDIIADGSDNFATRYLVSDACYFARKPLVTAALGTFDGTLTTIRAFETGFDGKPNPTYRCLFPEPPPPGMVPSCAEGGVLGVLPGLVGTIQATEGIKLLLGVGEPLVGRLLLIDALSMRFRTVRLRKDPNCPACGTHELTELIDYDQFCGVGGTNETSVAKSNEIPEITPAELAERLRRGDPIDLIDVREPYELTIARIPDVRLVPLGTLADAIPTLDPSHEMVVICRTGARSGRAVQQLRAAGFQHVYNLVGGIHRWADEVDPSLPKY